MGKLEVEVLLKYAFTERGSVVANCQACIIESL
jgi:hypothetical protein